MGLEGKLYDSDATEIKVPEGHQIVIGKNGYCFIPIYGYEAKIVYKEPNQNDEKYKKALELCQPERSKREDSDYLCDLKCTMDTPTSTQYINDILGCGALNSEETH